LNGKNYAELRTVNSFLERVKLNKELWDNLYWILSVDDRGHSDEVPVGRGVVSSPTFCGKPDGFDVCDKVENHKGVVYLRLDYTGKGCVKHRHLWCHKPSCPVCFIRGYAVREAHSIECALTEAAERFGSAIEHFTVSVPEEDYCLPYNVRRRKCEDAALDRGVLGAAFIYHGYRVDHTRMVLTFSPHFHGLGIIGHGGFDRCRDCVHARQDCGECDGFKGREVRGYARDRYLVKVFEKRQTVGGTAFYQLHHATIKLGLKRSNIVCWFGVLGNSVFKRKGAKVKPKALCPVCALAGVRTVMAHKKYVGKKPIAMNIGDPCYVRVFPVDVSDLEDFVDKGGGWRE
jgi:hypothetical protein